MMKTKNAIVRCDRCGSYALPDEKYCSCCGAPLPRRCRRCGAKLERVLALYCPFCGSRVTDDGRRTLEESSAIRAAHRRDRKQQC